MSAGETFLWIAITAAANGAVMWGVVKTELRWLRADVTHLREAIEKAHARIDELVRRAG